MSGRISKFPSSNFSSHWLVVLEGRACWSLGLAREKGHMPSIWNPSATHLHEHSQMGLLEVKDEMVKSWVHSRHRIIFGDISFEIVVSMIVSEITGTGH